MECSTTLKRKGQLCSLKAPPFLLALLLLLVNDLYLKGAFPNAFTGKLSDFAGLFVFAVFLSSIFPRAIRTISVLTGVLFILWKSPWSQGAIDAWNGLPLFQVGRTEDWSDLTALSVLPLVYVHQAWSSGQKGVKISPVLPMLLSCFAILATSYRSEVDHRKDYEFSCPPDSLMKWLHSEVSHVRTSRIWERRPRDTAKSLYVHRYEGDTITAERYGLIEKELADTIVIDVRDSILGSFRAYMLIEGGKGKFSELRSFQFRFNAPNKEKHAERLPGVFERRVIAPLRDQEKR
ncbi:MAG: hypothetical protein ABEH38_02045 [Flavobacteriales bacterium]